MNKKFYAITESLIGTIKDRKSKKPKKSYTAKLFKEGNIKIIKKVAEESAEVVIASLKSSKKDQVYELADLWYHLLVLLEAKKITLDDIGKELEKRFK